MIPTVLPVIIIVLYLAVNRKEPEHVHELLIHQWIKGYNAYSNHLTNDVWRPTPTNKTSLRFFMAKKDTAIMHCENNLAYLGLL